MGWRSGRDSNPRDGFPPAPLAGVCLRPLGHRSACSYMRQVKAEQELFPCGGWPQANGVFSYPVTRNQGGCPAVVSGAPRGGLKSHIGDAPVLPDLLSQIPENQEIGSVTAGGACDTRRCHDEIAECGAHAVIPPRKNEKPWKTITAGAVARNEALRSEIPRPRPMATTERRSPPRSHRNEDAWRQAAGPAAHGAGL